MANHSPPTSSFPLNVAHTSRDNTLLPVQGGATLRLGSPEHVGNVYIGGWRSWVGSNVGGTDYPPQMNPRCTSLSFSLVPRDRTIPVLSRSLTLFSDWRRLTGGLILPSGSYRGTDTNPIPSGCAPPFEGSYGRVESVPPGYSCEVPKLAPSPLGLRLLQGRSCRLL